MLGGLCKEKRCYKDSSCDVTALVKVQYDG